MLVAFWRMYCTSVELLQSSYDAGTLRPVLDRTFPFDQTLAAIAYVEQGRTKGKIVVTMPSSGAL
jgi:NADPH:quinone reductase-like Zn-dependent oxidoreductase